MVHLAGPRLQHSQNFLTSSHLVDQLLDRSTIGAGDPVLDIGAGRGLITDRLAKRGAQVLAIEQDAELASALRERFAEASNVRVHEADFLTFHLPTTSPYKVFANIPFAITAQIVAKLTAAHHPPLDSYLCMQREAAERFMGEPHGTLRAALLHPWFEPILVHCFRRTDFTPRPQVDVVMLRLRKRGPPLVLQRDAGLYRDFVTYCFTARCPSLRTTLATLFDRRKAHSIAKEVHIQAHDTPTMLRVEMWLALFEALRKAEPGAFARVQDAERRLRSQQRTLRKVHRTRRATRSEPSRR